jgi:hypothetical protein
MRERRAGPHALFVEHEPPPQPQPGSVGAPDQPAQQPARAAPTRLHWPPPLTPPRLAPPLPLFRRVAWERGQLTPERLASMDHPITGHPIHLPHMYDAFQHYLWILKTTHSGGWVVGR